MLSSRPPFTHAAPQRTRARSLSTATMENRTSSLPSTRECSAPASRVPLASRPHAGGFAISGALEMLPQSLAGSARRLYDLVR